MRVYRMHLYRMQTCTAKCCISVRIALWKVAWLS